MILRVRVGAGLALVAGFALGAGAAQEEAQTAERLADVVKELNALDAWLDEAGQRLADAERRIAAADERIAGLSGEARRIERELAQTKQSLTRLAGERETIDLRRAEQARRIARHARDAWRYAGQDFFKLLLNQQDPDDFDRMIRYHGYFSRARLGAIDAYRETLAAIDENERAVASRREALTAQQEELAGRRAALVGQRRERERLLARLRGDVGSRREARDRLAEDRRRMEALLARLREQARDAPTTAFVASKGSLRWPVAGRLAQHFGEPRAGGRMRWEGVYFEADAGAEVYAVHSGRVVFADWLRGFGFLAIVDHGDGHLSLYGNADDLFKGAGDWVESGEPIAAAGNSGGETRSGLYFEVRSDGQPTDPLAWLERTQPR